MIFNILKKLRSPLYLWDKIEINTFASAEKTRIFNSLFFSSILEILVFQIKTYFGICEKHNFART